MSEAAQSRRAVIAGTRDDLPTEPAPAQPACSRLPVTTRPTPWPPVISLLPRPLGGTFADQVSAVARRVQQVTGHQPVALDLTRDPAGPVHAVQVICPGARSRSRRLMPR
ncbi:YcaO-like family protein [Streptomyces sp. NPDC047097]|uniref:YcaO-like family protein n=1 Tax=Streptomyces sp. NPDC047097 TaxID=3155260 RepID=UPI0033C9ED57